MNENVKMGKAMTKIMQERCRQEELKKEGRFQFTCADKEMNLESCAIVLGEEFGELCRAILEFRNLTFDRLSDQVLGHVGLAKIESEVIQIAAVAMAIAERFQDE